MATVCVPVHCPKVAFSLSSAWTLPLFFSGDMCFESIPCVPCSAGSLIARFRIRFVPAPVLPYRFFPPNRLQVPPSYAQVVFYLYSPFTKRFLLRPFAYRVPPRPFDGTGTPPALASPAPLTYGSLSPTGYLPASRSAGPCFVFSFFGLA